MSESGKDTWYGSEEVNELVSTIRGGIADREFYLLMDNDDRLRLIVSGAKDGARRERLLNAFASEHGWSVSEGNAGFMFRAVLYRE